MSFINSFLFQLAFGDWFGFFFFDCWWSHYRSLSTRSRNYRIGCTWTLSIWYTIHRWYETNPTSDSIGTELNLGLRTPPYLTYRARSVFNRIFRFEMGRNSSSLALSPYGRRSEGEVQIIPQWRSFHTDPSAKQFFCGEKGQDQSLLSKQGMMGWCKYHRREGRLMPHVGYPQSPRWVGSCISVLGIKGISLRYLGIPCNLSFFDVLTRVLFCLLSKQIHLDQARAPYAKLRRAARLYKYTSLRVVGKGAFFGNPAFKGAQPFLLIRSQNPPLLSLGLAVRSSMCVCTSQPILSFQDMKWKPLDVFTGTKRWLWHRSFSYSSNSNKTISDFSY